MIKNIILGLKILEISCRKILHVFIVFQINYHWNYKKNIQYTIYTGIDRK